MLAGSILGLLSSEKLRHAQLLEGARHLHQELGLLDQKMMSFTDVSSFEERLGMTITVMCPEKGNWCFFTTGEV